VKITEDEVRYVAGLANLKLTEEEIHKFCADLGEILTYMDKLNEVDTHQVEPMAQVLYDAGEIATLRADQERAVVGPEAALANAPLASAEFFKVPKVIER